MGSGRKKPEELAEDKVRAEKYHADLRKLIAKVDALKRDSLKAADRLMQDGEYRASGAWYEQYERLKGAELVFLSKNRVGSLLGQGRVTFPTSKFSLAVRSKV